VPYVEPLSDARTPLADFVNSLLGAFLLRWVTDIDYGKFIISFALISNAAT
jgi:hypothetical protein